MKCARTWTSIAKSPKKNCAKRVADLEKLLYEKANILVMTRPGSDKVASGEKWEQMGSVFFTTRKKNF